jgi:hypothetical protein
VAAAVAAGCRAAAGRRSDGGLALVVVVGGGGAGDAVQTVAAARINLASPDRGSALRAALGVTAAHPLTGAGPGHAELRRKEPDGGIQFFAYAHNEYAQTGAELGLVGLALLAILLVAVARLLWSARATGPSAAAWAGVVAALAAFAVHSGFDFVWHLPAVVLTVMLLVGVVLPTPYGAGARKGSVIVQGREEVWVGRRPGHQFHERRLHWVGSADPRPGERGEDLQAGHRRRNRRHLRLHAEFLRLRERDR